MVDDETCPASLRTVLDLWRAGQVTSAELIEASYEAQLGMLPTYRRLPLPTPPEAVREYRALTPAEKRPWSAQDTATFHHQHQAFFEQGSRVTQRNADHLQLLLELLEWAKRKPLSEQVIQLIESQIAQHEDVG